MHGLNSFKKILLKIYDLKRQGTEPRKKNYTPKGGLVILKEAKTHGLSAATGCCRTKTGYVLFCFILWGQIYPFFGLNKFFGEIF